MLPATECLLLHPHPTQRDERVATAVVPQEGMDRGAQIELGERVLVHKGMTTNGLIRRDETLDAVLWNIDRKDHVQDVASDRRVVGWDCFCERDRTSERGGYESTLFGEFAQQRLVELLALLYPTTRQQPVGAGVLLVSDEQYSSTVNQ